ncbi:MAG TPA: IclR family transcriptional regulator [Gaiellaceae bacterium]|jgi:IclR family acetate operon transcriptional repressor
MAPNGSSSSRASLPTAVSGAQTLLRGLDILEAFINEGSSLTLAEVSRSVGLTTPTTHRLLKALAMRGMVVDDGNRHYSLGPAVMRLALAIMNRRNDLIAVGGPTLERLRILTGETVSLHTILGEERVCIVELVSPEPIRMESGVGHVHPLFAGAAGKVLIAWNETLVERLPAQLPRIGPSTISTRAELEVDLADVRKRGYATSNNEVVAGASSLAVPVFDSGGAVAAAINIAGPTDRWNDARIAKHAPAVLAEAQRLMQLLASSGAPAVSAGLS